MWCGCADADAHASACRAERPCRKHKVVAINRWILNCLYQLEYFKEHLDDSWLLFELPYNIVLMRSGFLYIIGFGGLIS